MKSLRKWIMPALLCVTLVSFIWGTMRLLLLRFEKGDVYPPYSSLRSDPLGAKALYESLGELPGISVERNYQPLSKLEGSREKVLFILGTRPGQVSFSMTRELDAFVRRGGRLVIAFDPMAEHTEWLKKKKIAEKQDKMPEQEDRRKETEGADEQKATPKPADEEETFDFSFAPTKWGFSFAHAKLADAAQGTKARLKESPKGVGVSGGLPESISCHTSLYFDHLDAEWRVLYERGGSRALVIERPMNQGSIVLSALSYFVSNEAMKDERHPELLGFLAGDRKRIIFDEFHHAVAEEPGVATLGRKYHLEGLFAGIVLVAILFVWKNAIAFVPSREERKGSALAKGKDSTAGLVNLLRRNIPMRKAIRTCLEEWKKSFAHGRTDLREKIGRMDTVVAQKENETLHVTHLENTYNEICEILEERK